MVAPLCRGRSWLILTGVCVAPEVRICRGTPAEGTDSGGGAGTTWGKEMEEEVWIGETGTSWGMDRGTRCPAAPPLACGAGTTCVGEAMEMTCGPWTFPGAGTVAWFSPPLQLMGEMETMVVVLVPSFRAASCCGCTSRPPAGWSVWLWKWAAGAARGATGTS